MTVNPSTAVARRLVSALVGAGVEHVVYCPGSRDAPIGYALADAEAAGWLHVHVRLDERSAGFVALGLSRGSMMEGLWRPAVVVTTSGTAVANLHPAVLEADASGVPLIVCSADRPHEMWQTGANQTTTQEGIYGTAPRFFGAIPAGFPADDRLDGLVLRAVTAASGALSSDPGPVHLNVGFRDPLVPDEPWHPVPPKPRVVDRIVRPSTPVFMPPLTDYQGVLGTNLADEVEAVLVLGHPTLSRPVTRLLANQPVTVVADGSRWTDVAGGARVVPGPITVRTASRDEAWLARWKRADHPVAATRKDEICAAIWADACREVGPLLVLGASAVIRSFDRCAVPEQRGPVAIANRGLAGIDGTASTGVGLHLGLGMPVRVVVGDLTAAHDATALLRGAAERDIDVQVVVLNDAGGAIFTGLEHAAAPRPVLERFFLTPQELDLAGLAKTVGARYQCVETTDFLTESVRGRSIVEVTLPQV